MKKIEALQEILSLPTKIAYNVKERKAMVPYDKWVGGKYYRGSVGEIYSNGRFILSYEDGFLVHLNFDWLGTGWAVVDKDPEDHKKQILALLGEGE